MSSLYPMIANVLVLTLAAWLIRRGASQLHYRDAPYLLFGRHLLWGALSVLFQGVVLVGVVEMWLNKDSAVWWLAALLGSLPALLTLAYAVRVIGNPRQVAMANKRRWKGPELVP